MYLRIHTVIFKMQQKQKIFLFFVQIACVSIDIFQGSIVQIINHYYCQTKTFARLTLIVFVAFMNYQNLKPVSEYKQT